MMWTARNIVMKEGVSAFFRGASASFMFVVPKYALTFVILGRLQVWARRHEESRQETQQLHRAFQAVDVDQDGVISPAEIRKALRINVPVLLHGSNMTAAERNAEVEDQVRHILEQAADSRAQGSTDQPGEEKQIGITFKEFAKIGHELRIMLRLRELWKAFMELDHDGDGRVHVGELKRAVAVEIANHTAARQEQGLSWFLAEEQEAMRQRNVEKARKLVDGCGVRADGTVGFEEFLKLCNKLEDQLDLSHVIWLWAKGPAM